MADLAITEAITRTEEAIETGNYDRAIETCRRLLGELPEFATAHRLMGEAHLENGEFDDARVAFQRTLERDPQSIPAHLGLGKIAEEQGEHQAALAHYQVAWEIDPRRRDLREHVSRVSQQVYGEDGRLYLTRAALASLHFHAGRWDRAVSEAAQVLQEQHGRVDVQIRMAEALWRRGDVEQAAQVSGTVLRTMPSAVVPLLIQADISRLQGNEEEAGRTLAQARAIDPAGVRAADLVMVGQEEQSEFLIVEDEPTIDESVLEEAPAGRYAPAPDFMSETMSTGSAYEQTVGETPAAAVPPGEEAPAELQSQPPVQPFRWDEIDDQDLEASDLSDDRGLAASAGAETADEAPSFELFSDEELEQARPGDDRPTGFTGVLSELDEEGVQPFDLGAEPEDDVWVTPDPGGQETSELSSPDEEPDLVLDQEPDSVHGQSTEFGTTDVDPFNLDWAEVDREIEDAIPGETPPGYTGELRALDETGVEPFSFEDRSREDILADEQAEDAEAEREETPDTTSWEFEESVQSNKPDSGTVPPAFSWDDIDLDSELEGEAGTMPLPEEPGSPRETVESLFGAYDPQPFDRGEPEAEAYFGSMLDEEPEAEPETVPDSVSEPSVVDQFTGTAPEQDDSIADTTGEHDFIGEYPDEEIIFERSEDEMGGLESGAPIEYLRLQRDLIERARQAKEEVVSQGRIVGTDRLPSLGPDVNELRSRVEAEPNNPDHRVELANALSKEDPALGIHEFRWVYANAGERAGDVLERLAEVASRAGDRESEAHVLAAAFYRRSGDWQAAASHYQESILARPRAKAGQ